MSLVSGSAASYMATDQILVDQIVYELKSQGIFDTFRKECIADVDTKPAYQNLRQRVEGSVSSFLKEQNWNPESNKNQLREMLRKNIYESGFLETGVERIVNQVVNPKINTIFLPKVKEVFYKYIGLQTPPIIEEKSSDIDIDTVPKVEAEPIQQDLLPTDLEAVSPDNEGAQDSNSMAIDDDDTSPPFEPIDEDLSFKLITVEENSMDSHLSGMSGIASHDSQHSNKDNNVAMQQLLESDSQVSKNSSSDDRLSIVTDEASNTKVDMLVVNDGVVVAMEITQTSEDSDDKKDNKIINSEILSGTVIQDNKDLTITDDLEDTKIKEETNNLKVKEEILGEDSSVTISAEVLENATKQDTADSISKPSKKDHKKDLSRHHSSSKSRDKSRDAKDYRENKDKSKSTSSSSNKDKDSKSKISSSSSSNRHSSDKEHSSSAKKYCSSSKHRSSTSSSKDKSSSSSSNKDKDKHKNKDSTISVSKDKDSSTTSNKRKESSKDHSSSKSSSTSSKDKSSSSSKEHSKESKSKSTSSNDKSYKSEHRSSSARKYSSSSTTREDSSKSHSSSSTTKDKRDKKDNNTKDDHFSSKTQHIERRSTDRDSNDGQTKSKGGTASNGNGSTTMHPKSEEQRSTNTSEDCSSSNSNNSKDGSSTDCCQAEKDNKVVPLEMEKGDQNINTLDHVEAVAMPTITDDKLVETLVDSEEKRNADPPLPKMNKPELVERTPHDFVETLDAIKSHLAEYKLDDQQIDNLPKIKLPKFASNFREARKIMKLRKQLKLQNKLRKMLVKANSTDSESTEQKSVEGSINGENGEELNVVENIDKVEAKDKQNTEDNVIENSLVVLEQELSNEATLVGTVEKIETDNTTKEELIKSNNDNCFYLDKITEKTTRYLNYTSSFIENLHKEISLSQNKEPVSKRKGQKRKISTLSSDSVTSLDPIEQDKTSSKVSRTSSPRDSKETLLIESNSTSDSIDAGKEDRTMIPSGDVTSATAHVHVVKQRRLNNTKATQRYTSDDLYKPRPFLKGTTKRTSGRVAN